MAATGFQNAIDEARGRLEGISNLLIQQNEHLERIANKPSTVKNLSKLNVSAAPKLISKAYPSAMPYPEEAYEIATPPLGTYWKINTWAYFSPGGKDKMILSLGTGANVFDMANNADGGANLAAGYSHPDLIVPPGIPVLISWMGLVKPEEQKPGIFSMQYTSYELSA